MKGGGTEGGTKLWKITLSVMTSFKSVIFRAATKPQCEVLVIFAYMLNSITLFVIMSWDRVCEIH